MEETISLQEILKLIKKRLVLIISLTIVGVCVAAVLNIKFFTPIYQANTQILVNQKVNDQEGLWYQIETDLQLISTYNVIIKSPAILNKVIEQLNLKISSEQLMDKIIVSNENNSKVVNISIIDKDHQQAVRIANTVAEVFKEEIPSLMNVDNVNVLSVAELSDHPSPVKPNKSLNIAIGAVIGIMLGMGVTFLLEILDTTIKDEKDVEEILGIPILGLVGSIPLEKKRKPSAKTHRVRGSENAWVEK